MKKLTQPDRREKRRFWLALPLHFRASIDGATSRWGIGSIQDMSSSGISFRCRREFPEGAVMEMIIDWPAARPDRSAVSLHISGIVLRSRGTKTALRLTSHHFEVESRSAQPMGATA